MFSRPRLIPVFWTLASLCIRVPQLMNSRNAASGSGLVLRHSATAVITWFLPARSSEPNKPTEKLSRTVLRLIWTFLFFESLSASAAVMILLRWSMHSLKPWGWLNMLHTTLRLSTWFGALPSEFQYCSIDVRMSALTQNTTFTSWVLIVRRSTSRTGNT